MDAYPTTRWGTCWAKRTWDASQSGDDLMTDQLSTGIRRQAEPLAARDALFAAWDE